MYFNRWRKYQHASTTIFEPFLYNLLFPPRRRLSASAALTREHRRNRPKIKERRASPRGRLRCWPARRTAVRLQAGVKPVWAPG